MQQILGIYEKETALGLAASCASERPYWERISQALRYWQDSPQRAVQEFLAGLSEEDARLQTGLGISYYLASEQEFHLHATVYWFCRASDNGSARAQCALGACYLTGAGLEANPQSAEGWFRTAAEQGYAPGQFMLGKHLYQHQFGAFDHKVQAVGWFRKSAEQGYIPAQYVLGLCYLDGSALPQDREQGIFWIGQAAEQGDRKELSIAEFLKLADTQFFSHRNREFSSKKLIKILQVLIKGKGRYLSFCRILRGYELQDSLLKAALIRLTIPLINWGYLQNL